MVCYFIGLEGWGHKLREELEPFKIILVVIGHISRRKANLEKSTFFGINVDLDQLDRMTLILDCKVSNWPIPYLGLSLGGKPKDRCILGHND